MTSLGSPPPGFRSWACHPPAAFLRDEIGRDPRSLTPEEARTIKPVRDRSPPTNKPADPTPAAKPGAAVPAGGKGFGAPMPSSGKKQGAGVDRSRAPVELALRELEELEAEARRTNNPDVMKEAEPELPPEIEAQLRALAQQLAAKQVDRLSELDPSDPE